MGAPLYSCLQESIKLGVIFSDQNQQDAVVEIPVKLSWIFSEYSQSLRKCFCCSKCVESWEIPKLNGDERQGGRG